MSWKQIALGDVADMKYGKMPPSEVLAEEGYPVFSGYRVTGYAKEFTHKERMLVVVARGVGGTGDVKISPPQAWITNLSIVLDLRRHLVDRDFLFYKLKTEPLREALNTGAAQAQITIQNLAPFQIRVPDLATQRTIAATLVAYDDLIANNKRRISLLEQSARLLFKEWFVSLRYPGCEHDKRVGGVPTGWSKLRLSDVSEFVSRGISPRYDDDAIGLVINQKCIRNRLLDISFARRQSKKVPEEKLVRFGDVLVNSTGAGTLGRVAQVLEPIEQCTVDSHVTIVRPSDSVGIYFIGFALTGMESYIATLGRGATNQTELSKTTIEELPILISPRSLRLEFEAFAKAVMTQILTLSKQNNRLVRVRDLLLPRLMDGRLTV